MSRKATCADNVSMENFFVFSNKKCIMKKYYCSIDALRYAIRKYIDSYNNERIKTKLAGLSPVQYRTQTSPTAA